MIKNALTTLALSVGSVAVATPALANPNDNIDVSVYGSPGYRDGFTFGLGIGGGDLQCRGEGCGDFTSAGSFDVHVGGMARYDLAVLFDAWWMVHDDNNTSVNQGIFAAALQYWPIEHLFLRGGIGVARSSYTYNGTFVDVTDHSELVPAFTLAVGIEPFATDSIGIDIQLKYGTGFYSDGDTRVQNIALAVGVSFY